jgi:hypothetical protein
LTSRIIIAALTICLVITACSKTNGATADESTPAPVPTPSPSSAVSNKESSVSEAPKEEIVSLPNPVTKKQSGVEISVQPQIELLAVIQYLSDYDETFDILTDYDFSYKDDIDAHFSDFTSHEAVAFINKYIEDGYSYDLPPTDAVMINQDFTLDETAYAAGKSLRDMRTDADINELIRVMKSFFIDSEFNTFFLSHTDYYQSIIDNTAALLPDWDMTGTMESFYGKKMGSYNIVLSSLYKGGFGPGIERDNGLAVYSIIGPANVTDGLPVFGSTESLTWLVLHEFGHSFIPIAGTRDGETEIWNALDASAYLLEPIQKQMEQSAYYLWPTVCEELVLRAVVVRMMEEYQNNTPTKWIKYENDKGFIYIQAAYDSLQKYIDNREAYPVFDTFIPVLIGDIMTAYPQAE